MKGAWSIVLGACVLALGCQALLDFAPRSEGSDGGADARDGSSDEAGSDGGPSSDATTNPDAIVDAGVDACAHTFCEDFENTTTALDSSWHVVADYGSLDAGEGNDGSRGLRCASEAVMDAATSRRAYVARTYNLDGGAQTIRAKVALDCRTPLPGRQYVIVLSLSARDPKTGEETAEALFVRRTSADGGSEKATLQITGTSSVDVDGTKLPAQWIDVVLEVKLNAGAWAKDASAGTVTAKWIEYAPSYVEHALADRILPALMDRDGGQFIELRTGIEYLTGGTGESVDIGVDDVEFDLN